MSEFFRMFKYALRSRTLMLLSMVFLSSQTASAAQSTPISLRHDRASLITDRDQVGPDQVLHVALRLQLQPGWHTYWKNPGDAGEATSLTVTSGPPRVATSSEIIWPTPSRIPESGLMAYGYEGDVILPLALRVPGRGPVTLNAHAEWLVCAQTCVPEKGNFSLSLPGADVAAPEGRDAPFFAQASRVTPQPAKFAAQFDTSGRLTLEDASFTPDRVLEAWFIPQATGIIDQIAPQNVSVSDKKITLQLKWAAGAPTSTRLGGVVVAKNAGGQQTAYNVTAQRAQGATARDNPPLVVQSAVRWPQAILYAFLGGVILNLMPCVFPVLAMKALTFVKAAGAGRRRQIGSACGYALGVVGTFVALACLIIGLREAGAQIGWGFQFQSGLFVLGVTWLLFLLGLNLLGVFEITPAAIDGAAMSREGWTGDILTGVLAVIVATPCTAPFMGSALAVALSANAALGATIFAAMGVGLAAPYILIAAFPKIGQCLPRPGAWMIVLKQILAFPLFGTCVWLLWVATVQGGPLMTLVAAAGAVSLGFATWLFGISQHQRMRGAHKARSINLVLAMLILIGTGWAAFQAVKIIKPAVSSTEQSTLPQAGAASGVARGAWSPDQLAALRAAGKPVFVDMTAAWCLTCLINERVALSSAPVRAVFAQHQITTLVGDWTRKDDRITAYLAQFGRDGVPLYVFYAPGKEGIILPQILTPQSVNETISHALATR